MCKRIATVTSISYNLTNGLMVGLSGYNPNVYYISTNELHYGGKNCEIKTLVVGSKIEFDFEINEKTRSLHNVKIMSDGIREVDAEGNLIKW